jgi:hypothetical protein
MDYRGLLTLVPTYITSIKKLLKDTLFSNRTKSKAVTMLGSLLYLPNHYTDYAVPLMDNPENKFTMQKVKEELYEIILYLLNRFDPIGSTESQARSSFIMTKYFSADKYGKKIIYKAIYQEYIQPNPFPKTLIAFVQELVKKGGHTVMEIQELALNSLISLTPLFPTFNRLDKNITITILSSLAAELQLKISKKIIESKEMQVSALNCLNALIVILMSMK